MALKIDQIKDLQDNSIISKSGSNITLGASNDTIAFASGITNNLLTPSFSAMAASDQSISTTTVTVLNFGTEIYDTNNAYDGTNKFTVPSGYAGKYYFNAHLRIDGIDDTKFAQIGLYINGSTNVGAEGVSTNSYVYSSKANAAMSFGTNGIVDLSVGDELQVFIYQDSGTTSTVANYTGFRGFRIGA